jgi:hypothetical protein
MDMHSSSTWIDGTWSDLDNLFRRVDFLLLSSGGAIVPAGLWGFGSGRGAISVSAQLR